MTSDFGSEVQPEGRADLLLPHLNKATSTPSSGYPLQANPQHPPAVFPGNLNFQATFPVLPAPMQPYLDPSFQPFWTGNGDPNLDPFLPMPHLAGPIAIRPGGSGFDFRPAGAIFNPFASNPPTQVPAAPFDDAFGSNQFNVSSSSTTTATSKLRPQRLVFTLPSSQGRTLLSLLQPSIFASLLLLLPVVPCNSHRLGYRTAYCCCLNGILRGRYLPSSSLCSA